ncbi:hypothetical protein QR680_013991 [Steinernema hermaphroditum]|uniref:Beta-1,4-N-acetylgalactosaminyltransferase n=1 Tax=Steinernema hermaphroditum TaxID=289476 RepID=A0AA39IA39_9BILA|nr:hypothetical protein QR680_013991 [Steinernema hermaphroditum]
MGFALYRKRKTLAVYGVFCVLLIISVGFFQCFRRLGALDEMTFDEIEDFQALGDGSSRTSAASTTVKPNLPECANISSDEVDAVQRLSNETEENILANFPSIGPGGSWKPTDCVPRNKIAIVIPFRDRHENLMTFLPVLISVLQRQNLDFRFVLAEQLGTEVFNKGRVMNAGFIAAEKLGVDCVFFHDVDMLPQRTDVPEPYNILAGGVLSLTIKDYKSLNGYSNSYWGWGGEDDDMGKRILTKGMKLIRPEKRHRFVMLNHTRRRPNEYNPTMIFKHLDKTPTEMLKDGLNQPMWRLVNVMDKQLYHHVLVDVGEVPFEWTQRLNQYKRKKRRG